jgi:hypothetical protein
MEKNWRYIEVDRKFVEGVLLRCLILGFAVLIFWFVMFLIAGGLMYEVHKVIFGITISRTDFNLMNDCGIGLLKLFVFVFFLIPYIAMRWTDKSQKPAE